MHPVLSKPAVRVGLGVILVTALLLGTLFLVLGRSKQLDSRHRAFQFAEAFDFATGTLAGYQDYALRRLRAAHPELADEVLAGLAPFRMDPAEDCPRSETGGLRSGIVLTHDLLDSPYTMRTQAEFFQSSCFVVYGLLLPAHGARAGDLLRSSWQDWFAAQRFAARELGREVDNLYLGGHGIGGTLALLEAAANPAVDGLVLYAPRLDIKTPPWQAVVASMLGWLLPPARWQVAAPATTPYRDPSVPWRMLAETNGLVASTQAALPAAPAEIPVFMVLSQDDVTADPQAALDFMAGRTHPLSHTLVYSAQALTPGPTLSVGPAGFPEYGQLGLSHLGLMIQASDPTFGRSGTSRECSHYFRVDAEAYARCSAGEADFKGEITPANLARGVIQRHTYNPDLRAMMELLSSFIAPVARVVPRIAR